MDFSAELWGSHKSNGNDDCITGDDAATLDGAKAALDELKASRHFKGQWAYACIVGPGGVTLHEETNPDHRPSKDDDSEDRREFAMQQGMGLGIGAYNEAMGYDTEEPEPRGFGR